jgi:glycosyltransferase involved in cell wall biosynthesis
VRVLVASKALVVGAYQRKLEEIAAHQDVEHLTAVVPPSWQEPGGRTIQLEVAHTTGYDLRVEPIRFNGNFHLFYWPGLERVLRETRPDLVHLDEEPYNLATALGTFQARKVGARSLFFTWQNLLRRYPPPFSLFEQYVFRRSAHAIVGNAEAERVLRAKGYRGPATLIPQVGIDPALFAPRSVARTGPPTIGYVARLVEEKGIHVLLDALSKQDSDWRLHVIGSGPLQEQARARSEREGLADRITWESSVPSMLIPERLATFDVVVLPSLSRRHWKEQFGRSLVEAMACGVPVIGSACGEIPNVVGDAGIVVPEGDATALREALKRVLYDPCLQADLRKRGRERVLARYTHRRIAEQTVAVYRAALAIG